MVKTEATPNIENANFYIVIFYFYGQTATR